MCFGNTLRPHPGAENLDFPFKLGTERSTSRSPDCVGRCRRTGGRPGWPMRTPTSTRASGRAGCRGEARRGRREKGVWIWEAAQGEGGAAARGGPGGGMRAGGGGRPPARAGRGAPGSQRSRAAAGFGGGRVQRARAWKEGVEKREIRMNERGGGGRPGRRRKGPGRRGGAAAAPGVGAGAGPPRQGTRKPRTAAGPAAPASPPKWGRSAGERGV